MLTEKDKIRKEAKRIRDQLEVSPDWAEQAAALFMRAVPRHPDQVLSVYYPIGSEMDPLPLVERLWDEGRQVCLPVIRAEDRVLKFSLWKKATPLISSKFGTFELEKTLDFMVPDIVLVPLLAFDRMGNRMGYGQGYFDITLAHIRRQKPILAVGFAYAQQEREEGLPTEPHDQKLDMIVTQQRVFDFRSQTG